MLYVLVSLLLLSFFDDETVIVRLEASAVETTERSTPVMADQEESLSTTLVATEETTTPMDIRKIMALKSCRAPRQMRCRDGLTCIEKRWMCDGRVDCPDHSDEQWRLCKHRGKGPKNGISGRFVSINHRCPTPWFFCRDASACVEPARVCDDNKDCRDGSDEAEHCLYIKHYLHRQNLTTNFTKP